MTDTSIVQLLQISDTHCYAQDSTPLEWTTPAIYPNQHVTRVLQHLSTHYAHYHALLISGDLAQQEVPETYQRLNAQLTQFPLSIHVLMGNHDTTSLAHTYLERRFWSPAFIQYGHWHLLMVDTNRPQQPDGHLSTEQYQALDQYLATIPAQDYVVIVMHHHPMPIQSAWMDVMGLQQAEQFWQWAAQYPAIQAVLHGHIHQEFTGHYHYANGRNVAVYGTPATSVQLKSLTQTIAFDHHLPAWRTLQLHPNGSISTQVHYLRT